MRLGLAPPSSLLFPPAVLLRLPPPSSYNTPWALPWAEPWPIFWRGVHFVPAAPCLFCPPLPKPPSQLMRYLPPPSPTSPSQPLPPDPFLHQGDSSGGGNGTNLYACCVYLTPSPQAANSRRARKGGALSRDLAALSRADLASRPRTDHLALISQHHLAPISQSRSTILC